MATPVDIMQIISTFGAWGVVVVALFWMAKFSENQIEAARTERTAEAEQHKQEVAQLSTVIQQNTEAIIKLTDYITKEE